VNAASNRWTSPRARFTLRGVTDCGEHARCILALEEGTLFFGERFGAEGTQTGEVVFNTSMTGYQEVLTDPSYCGQIVTMTSPQIGNYGVNPEDVESSRPQVAGFIVKELARRHSNYRATLSLDEYLAQHNVIGLQGVDTRALTLRLRVEGAMRGVISTQIDDPAECVRLARESPSMAGADLVRLVAPRDCSVWTEGLTPLFPPLSRGDEGGSPIENRKSKIENRHVVAVDCGMKRNILRHLVDMGCRVSVVPPTLPAGEVLANQPDGVFVSNGPGDPAAVHYAIDLVKGILGKVPIFGICLGHQLLGLALGAQTFKLKFGHRGANQPVRNLATGRVEITSQNHGFAVSADSLESVGGVPTHINLNDHTLEGFVHKDWPILAVQYHPEASPGPHDATYLFDCFVTMMSTGRPPTGEDMANAQAALQDRR
jgi:carbamoyl-phosphate synthase small subunit